MVHFKDMDKKFLENKLSGANLKEETQQKKLLRHEEIPMSSRPTSPTSSDDHGGGRPEEV
jgi:hypothetical protein